MHAIVDLYCPQEISHDGIYPGPIIGFYSTKEKAANIRKENITTVKALLVDNKYYLLKSVIPVDVDDIQSKEDEKIKQEALLLLSDEQKRVLGVK